MESYDKSSRQSRLQKRRFGVIAGQREKCERIITLDSALRRTREMKFKRLFNSVCTLVCISVAIRIDYYKRI